jgi:DNA-binding transcriptional MerR regulator
MGDKDVSLEEIKKLMQELGGDAQAYLTMGQLQHLVNEKNAAEYRIKELESQAERLRGALSVLVHQCKGVDGWEQFPSAWIDAAESFISETPAQSLEAVKREAAQKAADYICHKLRYDFEGPRDMDATEDFIDNLDLSECVK